MSLEYTIQCLIQTSPTEVSDLCDLIDVPTLCYIIELSVIYTEEEYCQ